MFVDTHAHLCFREFADDLPAVIERAVAARVTRILSIATDLPSAKQTLAIAHRYPPVAAAVGLHPGSVPDSASPCDLEELRRLAADPAVVAIGETGLDYYRDARDDAALRQQQKELFRAQLELAGNLQLPVVIHNRAAEADILEIVQAHARTVPAERRPWGVMHCFAGDEAFARACVACGLLISLTGILTFKNAAGLRAVAAAVPLERLMLETDAPYLAPMPHRGKRNEPAYLPHIADVLAEINGVAVEQIARVTTTTAEKFFQLQSP
jgi:TatD DNase family protein